MKIENLSVGQKIKNYKELCSILEIDVMSGKSKALQLKELSRFCRIKKDGNTFIVKNIYKQPIQKPMNSQGSPYYQLNELILCELILRNGEDNEWIVTPNFLASKMGYVNKKFREYWNKKHKLSDEENIPLELIDKFYDKVSASYSNIILRTLKAMEKQRILLCNELTYVIDLKKGHTITSEKDGEYTFQGKYNKKFREATKVEREEILRIDRELLDKFDCKNMSELYYKKLAYQFYETRKNILIETLGIS